MFASTSCSATVVAAAHHFVLRLAASMERRSVPSVPADKESRKTSGHDTNVSLGSEPAEECSERDNAKGLEIARARQQSRPRGSVVREAAAKNRERGQGQGALEIGGEL